ncbi:MAG: hypothetical protein D6731_00530 [Planctomycetota bacterium]|nr:MAG: hypothetical protein D6731_00530 [Planctomycetota bacterium]
MADARERRWERAAAAGEPGAEGRLLAERVRRGRLSPRRLELLAVLGDPAACAARGAPAPRAPRAESERVIALREVLAETAVWCRERATAADPKGSLRSDALRTAAFHPPWAEGVARRAQAVAALCARRAQALGSSGWPSPAPRAHGLGGGRLLCFDPDATLSDGAAEEASEGFFDADNLPPWDTWLAYAVDGVPPGSWQSFGSYLVCYVPPALLGPARRGVEANPEGSLCWADDLRGPFARALRAAGFLAVG